MKAWILLFCSFPAICLAECPDLSKFSMALSVHGSNWANARSTRTPDGGAYKTKSLECEHSCKITEAPAFTLTFEPEHPDANTDGYVQYPDIDQEKERAAISTYAKAIHLLADKCKEEVTSVGQADSLLIKYKNEEFRSDIFNFDKSNKVVSWVREDKKGKTHIINF